MVSETTAAEENERWDKMGCTQCFHSRDQHVARAASDKVCSGPAWSLLCGCDGFTTIPRCKECGHQSKEHGLAIHSGGRETQPCRAKHCSCPHYGARYVNDTTDTPNRKDQNNMALSTKKFTLPDGREYVTRALGGFDNDVEGVRELVKMGKHLLLLGEPGCGKTALHQVAFPDAENEVGHGKMTAWDMLWRPRPKEDGTIVFDPSPLTRAALKGVPFYLDELMRLSDDAFTPLFSAMDGRGFIVGGNLDGTDLPVKPGFAVIGASNPLVRGAFLPDAIASRFHILTVETSEDLLTKLKLDERLLVIWRNLSTLDGGESWRPSIREMLAAQSFIDAGNMPQAAYALTGWRIPAREREQVASIIAPMLGVRVGALGGTIS